MFSSKHVAFCKKKKFICAYNKYYRVFVLLYGDQFSGSDLCREILILLMLARWSTFQLNKLAKYVTLRYLSVALQIQ